ncbi:FMN-dependent NADH-azoreductase [Shinella yambaruensis]|uniref:FMN dependent NADH:quinone oxidoreductase n=1 Tax=Shinella yambaruensis TaxID=415996 RepID=A0ABQ5ZCI4_9HYPH|nr:MULTISPECIES: FMN-dependent NADH-azoreductase [Shinella]CAI0337232.1 FMN-dependent NADH:quinone oxidoreductase [Rhizobiaceae bacterium]CAK7255737.1 FMN-dependent NADH:quinone oxidoreductase [Shinella sp. WSC3-e]MCJ8024279.1 FMN-dependent NADH-azoreductase [Shinella yambaruensis]MCU7980721.1 FMN-dependent NADH-azoreductase [Shinella yambaruensis]MDC7254527.1 FMN-dependent NADH-azoreductase [Shinella sp. YE25]
MNILHVDSGILGDHSVSRRLTAAVAAQIKAEQPAATITYRDLVANPLPHLSGAHLMAANAKPEEVHAQIAAEVAESKVVLDEFLAADTIILGVPMYNFSLPSQLKAWIDRVAVAGKTFRYTAEGPEGLAKGKKVIIVSTRGGHYSAGPASAMDHQESYLKVVLGFFGITDVELVRAEGLNLSPDSKIEAISEAERTISDRGALKRAS